MSIIGLSCLNVSLSFTSLIFFVGVVAFNMKSFCAYAMDDDLTH